MKHSILIIVGLTVLFTGTANALVTTTFNDVKAEVETRLGALPAEGLDKDQKKEKKTLEKVLKTFGKKSSFPKKDMGRVKDIVKLLNKQYSEDKAMETLLNTALDSFEKDVYAIASDVDYRFGFVGETNPKRQGAVDKQTDAADLDAEFENLSDVVEKSKFVKKVNKGISKYDKATLAALKKEDGLEGHAYAMLVKVKGGYAGAASCLKCHKQTGKHVMASGHWNWEGEVPNVPGHEGEIHGKNDIINNFCIAVPSNEARCTQCHPGYGYRNQEFNFKDSQALDCLICHDTTGTYKKHPKTAGNPDPSVNLQEVAMNVGAPTRENCGACHFFAGGGDNVKKGDLGSALIAEDIDANTDVHMGGKNFSCQQCHTTVDHVIAGNQNQDTGRVNCTDCHDAEKLPGGIHRPSHIAMIACQTCHIPAFSRQQATKIHWDWSTAGDKERTPVIDEETQKPDYNFMKGDFVWGKNVAPKFMWFNGTYTKTFINVNDRTENIGDEFVLSTPLGSNGDGKIHPFKTMSGVQPVDTGNGTILVPHLFGPGNPNAYWVGYNWDDALRSGAQAAGQTYTGNYGWIRTVQYLPINHEVAPKEQALGMGGCSDCHGENKISFPWVELGITKPDF